MLQELHCMERILILRNFLLTLPSIIYHGSKSLIEKFKHNKKDDIVYNTVETENLILLIHGYHGHPCNFNPLVNNLMNISSQSNVQDYSDLLTNWNIRAVNLNQFNNYDENTVQNEARLVLNYLEVTAFKNVILIGLSKGGLVCSCAYGQHDPEKHCIKKVITISSPLNGTRSCDLYLPKILDYINGNLDSVRNDLGYSSSTSSNTLNALLNGSNINKDCIYHIVPEYDHMIYPSDSAMYSFVKEDNIFRYTKTTYSHIGIPFNLEIAEKIFNWIIESKVTEDITNLNEYVNSEVDESIDECINDQIIDIDNCEQ